MRTLIAVAIAALALAGCGGAEQTIVVPSGDRMSFAGQVGRLEASSDTALMKKVEVAAVATRTSLLDVTVLETRQGQHVLVATIQSDDPASYMKHELIGFLDRMEWFKPEFTFVELLDGDGRPAWSAGQGHRGYGVGPLNVRPDLVSCNPVGRHGAVEIWRVDPPPCPAD